GTCTAPSRSDHSRSERIGRCMEATGTTEPSVAPESQTTNSSPRRTQRRCAGEIGRRFGNADVLIRTAIIEEKASATARQAFNKNYVWHLPYFFPLLFRREDGLIRSHGEFSRLAYVKNRDPGAVDEVVVCAVVDQHNSRGREQR